MDIDQSAMDAILFAERLAERLGMGSVVIHPDSPDRLEIQLSWLPRGAATARGRLNLSHCDIETNLSAEVHICVGSDWQRYSPNVRAFATWVRRLPMGDPDWHFKRDKSLCYVLDREWRDFFASSEALYGRLTAIDAAIEFCLNNTRWLLYKYVEAARRNLTKWDPAWQAWGHRTGVYEYLREKGKAA